MELLDYYRENLNYLRGLGAEFAAEYPKIARRLSLSEFECQDPYVERILEGTAFLAGRVEKKLDSGYFRLIESLLQTLAPASLYPVPSGAVLRLVPNAGNEALRNEAVLPALSTFQATVPGINTPCVFSTIADLPLSFYEIDEASYISRDLSSLGLNTKAQSALHLSLNSLAANVPPAGGPLLFYINMSDEDASLLQRQLGQEVKGVFIKTEPGQKEWTALEDYSFNTALFDGGPFFKRGFKGVEPGLRILQNFYSYPAFFKFFSLDTKGALLPASLEILISFERKEPTLATDLGSDSLCLNCAPCLNVFSKRSDRISYSKSAYEFHLPSDRSAAQDYEIINVNRIEFFNERNETLFLAGAFYDEDIAGDETARRIFYALHRRRNLFNRQSRQRSSYHGSEIFLTLSSQTGALDKVYQFSADMVCSNRDLPLLLAPGQDLRPATALVSAARFISNPTRPGYPLIENGAEEDFSALSPIIFNAGSMLFRDGPFPLAMLKQILRSYNTREAEEIDRITDGIRSISCKQISFRFVREGAVFFEWGWHVAVTLDETRYAGIGFYLFALVLKEVLLAYAPLNTPMEIAVETLQSGLVAEWKALADK
jgi:type VI secretion system VasI/ImpG family protein